MALFTAHYRSLDSSDVRAKGMFDFESSSRLGSKANLHDARIKMLENFGNDALSWTIEKVERRRSTDPNQDGQMELDFREAKKKKRVTTKRGLI